MTPSGYVPARGDAIWINLDPQAGHEQAGHRPAIVLSPSAYNARLELAIICPITSRAKGYPFEAPLPDGLAVSGVVLADQVKCVDWRARRARLIDQLPESVIRDVLEKLAILLPGIAEFG